MFSRQSKSWRSQAIFLLVCGIAFAAFFITPVGGHAEFVELVHFFGADLHLDAFVFRADNHGVQAFVAVAFRIGDVVVEFAGMGCHRLCTMPSTV